MSLVIPRRCQVGSVDWRSRRIRGAAARDEREDEAADYKEGCAPPARRRREQATDRLVVRFGLAAAPFTRSPPKGIVSRWIPWLGRAGPHAGWAFGSARQRRPRPRTLAELFVRVLEGRPVDAPSGHHL